MDDRDFGRNDGIKCHACGGKTFLSFDQGYGLRSYNCENCDETTTVQFERGGEYEDEMRDDYYEPPYDEIYDEEIP